MATKKQKSLRRLVCGILAGILLFSLSACGRKTKETKTLCLGIDVARYQGTIGWERVAEAGVNFAMVRLGYRTARDGVIVADSNARYTLQAASKAGLIGLTKSLARELASRGVTVNAVAPGFIQTDMTAALPEAVQAELCKGIPVGCPGQPEDVARAVAFLAAEESRYLTGQVLCVDGGMAM